jgi:hypothetical protein
LPSEYILNRWTKYAKKGFYIDKQGSKEDDLKARAALISRKATSIALKCSKSRELLDDLEKAIEKLELEAGTSLSNMQEKSNEVRLIPNECDTTGSLNGVISFRVPEVVKGPKNAWFKNVVEKKTGNKKKSVNKKCCDPTYRRWQFFSNGCFYNKCFMLIFLSTAGEDPNTAAENGGGGADPKQLTVRHSSDFLYPFHSLLLLTHIFNMTQDLNSFAANAPLFHGGYDNAPMRHFNMIGNSSTMPAPYIQEGYTSLLLGVDQGATLQSAVRKLRFARGSNHENM